MSAAVEPHLLPPLPAGDAGERLSSFPVAALSPQTSATALSLLTAVGAALPSGMGTASPGAADGSSTPQVLLAHQLALTCACDHVCVCVFMCVCACMAML
jgi:hypothetical protein